MPQIDDNDVAFYSCPAGTVEPRTLGYCDPALQSPDFLIRITPGTVMLPKGTPIAFTIHVKALRNFNTANPLVLKLLPVQGRGSAAFASRIAIVQSGKPTIARDKDRIIISMKKSDCAARVVIDTDYPPDWWSGFTTIEVICGDSQTSSVEGHVIVADRVPAAWTRAVWNDEPSGKSTITL